METFSALLALCVLWGEFPAQRPVTRGFDVFFDLRQNTPALMVIYDRVLMISYRNQAQVR